MDLLDISSWVGCGKAVVAILNAAVFVVMLTKLRGLTPEFRKTSWTSWLTEELPKKLLFIINILHGNVVKADGAA